tara:strand:+ start:637 stop:1761 length:1125 start_codon:yes stop_codon:yes gene_type:complete
MQNIHPLLDADKQRQAQKYEKENRIFGLLGSVISLTFVLWFYFFGFSTQIAHMGYSFIWTFLIYVVIFLTLSTLIGLPLGYYTGYVREHKWGFSNYTHKTWAVDQLKSFLLSLVLFPLLLGLLYWVFAAFPDIWWLVAGGAMAIVSVIFATLFPVVIAPIFNKYDPIEDESLVNQLTVILEKAGLKPGGFFRQDMSKQTKKENAFLGGLGKTRRVVMADNLLEKMNQNEIASVIAHEVGHYRYAHLPKNIIIGTAQQLVTFYLLDLVMKYFFPTFLTSNTANLALFPMIGLIMGILSGFLFGPLNNWISRTFERQADSSSLEFYPEKDAFLGAMAGLANRNLSNAYPSGWVKWLYYSHPPIGERLAFAEEYQYD